MQQYVPWYGLNGRPITDLEAAVLLTDLDARRVAYTAIPTAGADVIVVSTMFSVTPSATGRGGSLALWETIVVGDKGNERVEHHTSRKDAERHHEAIVADIRSRHGLGGETGEGTRKTDAQDRKTESSQSQTPAYATHR